MNGTWEGIEEAMREKYFTALVGAGNAAVLLFIYKTLKALAGGKDEEIQRAFMEPPPPVIQNDGKSCYTGCQAQIQINLAAFYIGSRKAEAASEAVRKAMILNRDLGVNAAPAYRFFSLVNLSRQRIDDALEYISFAMDQAEKTEQPEELFLACHYASLINFLQGNLSKAERLAVRAEKAATASGQMDWQTAAKFFRGRICFETGRYRDALDIFESIGDLKESSAFQQSDAMIRTVAAWIFRAKSFLGRSSGISTGLDGIIFAIEAAYFSADYERAAALAEDFLSSPEASANGFLFTEQPDWRSGFSQCEYLFRPEKVPSAKIAWVYRLMAQCCLHPSREAKTELLGSMQRFMRDELLPDTDPFDSFYYYAWFCILKNSGNTKDSSNVDLDTVVSMAYRRLQRRADRIDDAKTKQTFLTMSRWSSTLYLAARERNLI
jgi:tetratricopeptide (TPR) repeat protein